MEKQKNSPERPQDGAGVGPEKYRLAGPWRRIRKAQWQE